MDGGRFRASRLALGYVVLTPFLRVLLRYVLGGRVALWTFTLTRIVAIAVGCCLAFAATSPRLRRRLDLLSRHAGVIVLAGGAFLLVSHQLTIRYKTPSLMVRFYDTMASGTVNAVVIGAIVWVCVSYPPGAVCRLLNSKPMVYIGVLSYSLFL